MSAAATRRSARVSAKEIRGAAGGAPQPRKRAGNPQPWSWKDVVWVAVTLLIASALTTVALGNSLTALMPEVGLAGVRAVLLIIFYLMTLLVLAYRAHKRELPFMLAYRLRWNPLDMVDTATTATDEHKLSPTWSVWVSTLWVIALFIGLRGLAILYTLATTQLGWTVPPSENLTALFGVNLFGLISAAISIVILAPFIEELVFRVIMLEMFTTKFSFFIAALIQAAIFSLYHFSLWAALPNFILALACAYLAKKSKTAWPAVLLHVLYNAAVVAAAFYLAF